MSDSLEVAVVGAGPAGVGTAVALERLEVDYAVLERDRIGSSFRTGPTRSTADAVVSGQRLRPSGSEHRHDRHLAGTGAGL